MAQAGRPKTPLVLSEVERATLLRWAAEETSRIALRSRIVLACADGANNTAVADALGTDRVTVGKWRSRFVASGLDGLLSAPRSRRERSNGVDRSALIGATMAPDTTSGSPAPTGPDDGTRTATARRAYHSPLRQERAAQTRDRIVQAGSELVHELPSWDWKGLTFRAVAARAGVGERTIYRYFPTERELHDAIIRRLEEEAGIDYTELALGNLAEVAARSVARLPSFAIRNWARPALEQPALIAEDVRRRGIFLNAIAQETADWPDRERRMVAALLELLCTTTVHERMLAAWELTPDEVARIVAWALEHLIPPIRADHRP